MSGLRQFTTTAPPEMANFVRTGWWFPIFFRALRAQMTPGARFCHWLGPELSGSRTDRARIEDQICPDGRTNLTTYIRGSLDELHAPTSTTAGVISIDRFP